MKTILFLILLILIVPFTIATSPYQCVSQGLFESVFTGSNLTGDLMASDFLLHNGTSCCGAAGGDSDTTYNSDEIWIYESSNVFYFNRTYADSQYYNKSDYDFIEESEFDNDTIIRNHNTSWVDNLIDAKVVEAFLTAILNSVYLPISFPADSEYVNETMLDNDTIIRNHNTTWITDNQNYNTTKEMQTAINISGDFYNLSIPCSLISDDGGGGDGDYCADDTTAFDPSVLDYVNQSMLDNGSIIRSGVNDSYIKSFDSNASTACNDNEVLLGDGTCYDLGNIQNSTRNRTGNVIYAQLSDLKDQPFAATNTPQPLNFSTEDEIYGLVHSTTVDSSEITIVTSAIYTMIAQPQVATGAGGAGTFHMWLEKYDKTNWINVSNSNVELVLASNEENVIPLAATLRLEPDEKIRVMGSVSDTAIKLDAQTPAGEPVIPSIIFSMFEVGGTNLSYIGNCSGATCDITNTGTLDGYEGTDLLDNTFNSTDDIWSAISNQTWDIRIDTLPNISWSEINNSFKNFSQYLATYPNIDTDGTDDATIQQVNDSLGNHSQWIGTYPNVDTDGTDDLTSAGFQNYSVVRSYNISWLDSWYTGISYYKPANFTAGYYAITSRWDKDNFSSAVAPYALGTSLPNLTRQDVNDSVGNLTQYLATYPNIDTDSTNDLINGTNANFVLLNITTNLTIHASNIWWNGSGICIGAC